MNQLKVGVDLDGEIARVVSVQSTPAGESFILRTAPVSDWRSALGADNSRVTIAIDDRLSNVRIVRPAIIDPALAREAAEYEARIAMIGHDPGLRIGVTHIGNSADPRAWLAVSTHSQAVVDCATISGNNGDSTLFLPKSVALGRGYLVMCEADVAGTAVLIKPGQAKSSICFIIGQAVVGTAQLKGISSEADDTELADWFSELRMVVRYRLSTDLSGSVNSDDAKFIWVGDPGLFEELGTISGVQINPVKLRSINISPESDAPALTADWLAALGAAFN